MVGKDNKTHMRELKNKEYIKKMAERLLKLTCPYDKSVVTVYVLEKFITQIISDVKER